LYIAFGPTRSATRPMRMGHELKHKLRLVQDNGVVADPISALSPDEQAHLLELADTALHNTKPDETHLAGTRAKEAHQRLKQELQDVLDKCEQDKNGAA